MIMKKLSLGLAVLLSGVITNSYADFCKTPFDTMPCYNGGFTFGVAGLYIQPSSSKLDYAIQYPGLTVNTPPLTTDFNNGAVKSVSPDYDWGYKINLGYLFAGTGNDITVTYSNFNHTNNDESTLGRNERLVATTTVTPSLGLLSAAASTKFNYQTLDVDLGQHSKVGCNTHAKLFAGVRFADLETNLDAHYTGTTDFDTDEDTDSFTTVTRQHSKFRGVGPRIGTNLNYGFGNGFGVVAQATGALIVGDFNSNFHRHTVIEDADDTTLLDVTSSFHNPKTTRVVPNVTGKLGLSYSYNLCNATRTEVGFEAGYQVDQYFNVVDRSHSLGLIGLDTTKNVDVSFSGPYVALQVKI